jgi:hypothetical protein
MVVHDVKVHHVGAGGQHRINLFTQSGKVRRQH